MGSKFAFIQTFWVDSKNLSKWPYEYERTIHMKISTNIMDTPTSKHSSHFG